MTENQYLPFGTAGGANVLSPAEYLALAARLSGFAAGVAQSEELNTVWRQASVVAAMIGQFVADIGGFDALDDGSVANLLASFERTIQGGKLNFSVAGGTPNDVTVTLNPAPAALTAGMSFKILIGTAPTSAMTLNVNGLGAKSITDQLGNAIQAGAFSAGSIVEFTFDGTNFRVDTTAKPGRYLNTQILTASGTYTPTTGCVLARVKAIGGAGAGGGAPASGASTVCFGAPGTEGSYAEGWVVITGPVNYTVGAGGLQATGAPGGNGGTTTFGPISCPGGPGGGIAGPTAPTFAAASTQGTIASGGSIMNKSGNLGGLSIGFSTTAGFGGAGGGGTMGSPPGYQGINSNGPSATQPGCGGAGTLSAGGNGALTGGNGFRGQIVIEEYGF